MADMDLEEFNRRKDIWDSLGNRLMSAEEVADFDHFLNNNLEESKECKTEGFIRAEAGDFCRFETVTPILKSYLASKKCNELFERYQGNASDPALRQELKSRLMEADLRMGFAFGGKDANTPMGRFMRDCERIANRETLIQTLQEPDAASKMRLRDQLVQNDSTKADREMAQALNQDLEQRVEMAKILFMNHLGKFQTKDDNGNTIEHDENVAEIYAHGGRTMFILPAGGNQDAVMKGIKGQHQELSGVKNRYFATHGVNPRTLNADGTIASESEELKLNKAQSFSFNKHQGMNVSVGGLGQVGPNGKVITSDGTNGHMYMHMAPGGKNTCGTVMVGFENSGPGKKGRMGSTHDASAKKAGGSTFLSDKSYLGAERGGRVVDLSGLSAENLTTMLSNFENGYRAAAKAAQEGNTSLLDACNDLLTGKQMSVGQLKGLMQGLNMPEQTNAVETARMGHPSTHKGEVIDPEQNPAIPMKVAPKQPQKLGRITQFPGLEQPHAPEFMKKPGIWDKLANVFSLFSKNSYVNRYKEYVRTLPQRIETYKKDMQEYRSTLEALERGENPRGLKEAYDRTLAQAKEQYGISQAEPEVQVRVTSTNVKTTSDEMVQRLENTLVNRLVEGKLPTNASKDAVENAKNELRDRIRETECFQKMSTSGDDNIRSVLDNPGKMSMVLSTVTNSIMENSGHNQKENVNEVPLRSNEMAKEQPQSAPRAMGGLGG